MKIITNYYNSIKENLKLEKQILLTEGITLILFTTLILIFNFNKPNTLTIFYLFPIGLVMIAIENLIYSNKTKEKDMKYWIINLVEGLLYLLAVLFILFYNISSSYSFIIIFSSFIIIRNIFKFLKKPKQSILEYINVVSMIIISIFSILYNELIIDNLYLYFILFYMLYGFIKIIKVIILNRKK